MKQSHEVSDISSLSKQDNQQKDWLVILNACHCVRSLKTFVACRKEDLFFLLHYMQHYSIREYKHIYRWRGARREDISLCLIMLKVRLGLLSASLLFFFVEKTRWNERERERAKDKKESEQARVSNDERKRWCSENKWVTLRNCLVYEWY